MIAASGYRPGVSAGPSHPRTRLRSPSPVAAASAVTLFKREAAILTATEGTLTKRPTRHRGTGPGASIISAGGASPAPYRSRSRFNPRWSSGRVRQRRTASAMSFTVTAGGGGVNPRRWSRHRRKAKVIWTLGPDEGTNNNGLEAVGVGLRFAGRLHRERHRDHSRSSSRRRHRRRPFQVSIRMLDISDLVRPNYARSRPSRSPARPARPTDRVRSIRHDHVPRRRAGDRPDHHAGGGRDHDARVDRGVRSARPSPCHGGHGREAHLQLPAPDDLRRPGQRSPDGVCRTST